MKLKLNPSIREVRLVAYGLVGLAAAPAAIAGDYEFDFQRQHGSSATFNVSGAATESPPNYQGDCFLNSVVYPNGDEFIFYYMPTSVTNIEFVGDGTTWAVRGGTSTTTGVQGDLRYSDATDEEFATKALAALRNTNLNSYVDLGGNGATFSFIMEFELDVVDDDMGPDEFGEILYFERGAGSGNSWLKIQAVDKDGTALGPWLVIKPTETVQTTPEATVYKSGQTMGTASIDVSRLGVDQFRYLKVSNDVADEVAYDGGGDFAPDFKIMAVMTDKSQLARLILYD